MFGRDGELKKLNDDRNNPNLPRFVRRQADEAHHKIVEQMKDRRLMDMRLELIRATRAGDLEAINKIEKRIRAYTGEDRETGL